MDIKTPIKEYFGRDVGSIIYEYIFDTCDVCKIYYCYEWTKKCRHCDKMVCNDCMGFHKLCMKKKRVKTKKNRHERKKEYERFSRAANKMRKV